MEILLVEDSLVDARVTIGALKKGQIQHRLTLIRDGEEAMEFLRRQGKFARAPRPDLILLDLLLPKKDGFAVLEDIRADEGLKDIPVVVLTASQTEKDRLKCELHHVASYITKPVNLDKFLSLVKQLKRYWLEDVILPSV
jgi:CheY-like chemotaxis protein